MVLIRFCCYTHTYPHPQAPLPMQLFLLATWCKKKKQGSGAWERGYTHTRNTYIMPAMAPRSGAPPPGTPPCCPCCPCGCPPCCPPCCSPCCCPCCCCPCPCCPGCGPCWPPGAAVCPTIRLALNRGKSKRER